MQDSKQNNLVESDYLLRTAFNPIRGLDEDLHDFINEFVELGTPRFVEFAELWKKHKFIHLIYGRRNQAGLSDILGCIFYRLIDIVQPNFDRNTFTRVCALYLLYAFHGKQPIRNQVRIRVSPEAWSGILKLANEAQDDGHLDVYYVFRQLCAANAFSFCANRQVLYPGAPLFDSPAVKHDDCSDDCPGSSVCQNLNQQNQTKKGSSRDALTACLPVVKALKSHSSALTQALQCLNLSLSRYAESKRLLGQNSTEDQKNEVIKSQFSVFDDHDDDDDEYDEFCHGLNLVTHPDSMKALQSISEDLIQLAELSCLDSRFTKKLISKPDPIECTSESKESDQQTKLRTSQRKRPMSKSPSKTNADDLEQSSDNMGKRRCLLRKSAAWSSFVEKEGSQKGKFNSTKTESGPLTRTKTKK